MFCEKCGKMNPDNAAFCEGCGNPIAKSGEPSPLFAAPDLDMSATAAPTPAAEPVAAPAAEPVAAPAAPVAEPVGAPVENPVPEFGAPSFDANPMGFGAAAPAPKKNNKLWIIIGAAAAVVVALVIILCTVFCGGSGAGSAEDVVDKYVSAMEDCDVYAMIELLPSEIHDAMIEEYGDEIDAASEMMDSYSDMIEGVTYRIVDQTTYSRDEVKDFEEEMNEELEGYIDEKIEVTAVASIEVECAVETKFGTQSDSEHITVFESDGTWYLSPNEINF